MAHVSYSETINASPEQVWAILADATRLPAWAYREGSFPYPTEGRYGTEQTEGVGTVWVGVSDDGQTSHNEVIEWEPPTKLAYKLQDVENAKTPMKQTSVFTLEPAGDATKVTWDFEWELTGGFSLNSLLFRFTGNSNFEEMMAGSLENLKKIVESEG